jgi:hypothetical protein
MALLAVSVGAAVFVVMRFIFEMRSLPLLSAWSETTIATMATVMVSGGAAVLWFILPIFSRGRR